MFGGCHQLKQQKVKTFDEHGKEIGFQTQDDPHYFAKALSKAQRNVIQSVIPAGYMARMIDRFLLMTGRQPLKQLPKPKAENPRVAKELPEVKPEDVKEFHQLEVLAFNRWHIQPAQLYKELGYTNKAECAETPWECFQKLQAIFEGERNAQNQNQAA